MSQGFFGQHFFIKLKSDHQTIYNKQRNSAIQDKLHFTKYSNLIEILKIIIAECYIDLFIETIDINMIKT